MTLGGGGGQQKGQKVTRWGGGLNLDFSSDVIYEWPLWTIHASNPHLLFNYTPIYSVGIRWNFQNNIITPADLFPRNFGNNIITLADKFCRDPTEFSK